MSLTESQEDNRSVLKMEQELDSLIRDAKELNKEIEVLERNKRKLAEDDFPDEIKKNKLEENSSTQGNCDLQEEPDCEIIEKVVPLVQIDDDAEDSETVDPQPSTSTNKVKQEPTTAECTSSSNDDPANLPVTIPVVVPSVKQEPSTVIKEEASSSTRESCKYGVRCYRRGNPNHNREVAHPGDSDYRRPNYPEPPKGTPPCPFGSNCYRRNPSHFQQFSHSEQESEAKVKRVRVKKEVKTTTTTVDYSILSEEEEDDDFSDDSMDEFIVNDNEVEDEEEDETDIGEED